MQEGMQGAPLVGPDNPTAAIYNRAVDPKHLVPGQIAYAPRPALNTIWMWLGGEWMLRRDGRAIPVFGPVPDCELDPQHNAIYEDTGKPKGKRHWFSDDPIAYGHRAPADAVGAIVPESVLEFLILKANEKLEQDMVKVEDPTKRMEFLQKREEQIRAANKPGESWDGKKPLQLRSEADDLRTENAMLKRQIMELRAGGLLAANAIAAGELAGDQDPGNPTGEWRGKPPIQPTTVEKQLRETSPSNPEPPPTKRGKRAK